MSDHADVIREALRRAVTNDPWGTDHSGYRDALTAAIAALDALVAERLSLNEQISVAVDMLDMAVTERDEARRQEHRAVDAARVATALMEGAQDACKDLRARVTELEVALEQVKAQQPETLAMIEANGFVFDSIGNEPGNWQHLAFTIYTDLCKVDSIAAAALAKEDTDE